MNKLKKTAGCHIILMLGAFGCTAFAQTAPIQQTSVYLQYGQAEHAAKSWTLGVNLPWRSWSWQLGSGLVTGHWDLWVSRWSAPYQGEDKATWILGAQPVLRWRPSMGQSPWFAEAGLGVSLASNRRYISDHTTFSTRYNFATHIGVGYLFGEQLKNEISLRLAHYSNAGIRHPNPGENFLQLRYARSF
ncbi:acyloxyacyl hydrolase [Comamonas aquatilis]|uniref:acyloxyacyl hydrolase n=1 Tax=Comamonas aquatilis TaxID=1778406 RepID=UPI0039F14664